MTVLYWKWDSSLSVGLDVIDQMVDYTLTHFAFEEEMMEKAGYKILPAHKAVHEAFTRQIKGYKQRFAAGEDVTRELLAALRVWLTNRIKRDDKDYAPFVRAMLSEEESWMGKTLRRFFG